jgi:hypothetical protein
VGTVTATHAREKNPESVLRSARVPAGRRHFWCRCTRVDPSDDSQWHSGRARARHTKVCESAYLESTSEYGHVRGVLARVEALFALDCPLLVLLQGKAPDSGLCLAQKGEREGEDQKAGQKKKRIDQADHTSAANYICQTLRPQPGTPNSRTTDLEHGIRIPKRSISHALDSRSPSICRAGPHLGLETLNPKA